MSEGPEINAAWSSSVNDPELSIVLPCYNEVEAAPDFLLSVAKHANLTGLTYEVIAIDDGSTDGTAKALDDLAKLSPWLRVLHFSRNFGHMAALTAGLDHAKASGAVISMDSDGHHPAEMVPILVEKWRAGADIVQTLRKDPPGISIPKRLTSVLFYKTINLLGDTPIPPGAADFRLMSREAVDALKKLPEKARFIRGLIFWIGYRMEYVEYDAPARIAGVTKYNFRKMIRFAIDGITSFSTVLLRMSIVGGLLAVISAGIYFFYVLWMYVFHGNQLVTGWSSIILTVLSMGGLNLIALGILGEYVNRIYSEVKNRPIYLLRDNDRK